MKKINEGIMKTIKKVFKDKDHQKIIADIVRESMKKPTRASEILVKNPSSWIKSLSSSFTWTNRELEWYFAEDRYLFAVGTKLECDKWVARLNVLIAKRQIDLELKLTQEQDDGTATNRIWEVEEENARSGEREAE